MAGRRKKKGKPEAKGRRVEHGFITYGGYIPELDMMVSEDGYYFKMYLAGETKMRESETGPAPEKQAGAMHVPAGFKLQLIAGKGRIHILLGTKTDRPEEAEEKFRGIESGSPYRAATCGEWFGLMSERLLFEPLVENRETENRPRIPGQPEFHEESVRAWRKFDGPQERRTEIKQQAAKAEQARRPETIEGLREYKKSCRQKNQAGNQVKRRAGGMEL